MTKAELVTELSERLSLYSDEALERLGRAVDRAHRRVTSEIGLIVSRRVTVSQAKSEGSANVTFSGIEKIERVFDDTSGTVIVLSEVTFDQLRRQNPGTTTPASYAIERMDANSVTIRLDVLAQDTDVLKADGHTTVADLADADAPAFPESFHEIILEAVLMDELRKKDDVAGAKIARSEYDRILSNLKFWIAKSGYLRQRQGDKSTSSVIGGASTTGGGSAPSGGTSYEQSGLITFDRAGTGVAPFAVAADNNGQVDNLNAQYVGGKTGADLVTGPASATDNAIARFDGATGKIVQDSGITIADGATGTLSGSNSGDVSLVNTAAAFLSLVGQVLTTSLVNLATMVTGRLPFANLTAATAASKLLGRGSAAGAGDFQEITLGTGLSMSGTTLNASSVAGADTQVQFNDGGSALGADSGLTFNKTTDALTIAGQLIISGASAGQIVFPASQNASANANTLDDYEEGTWTPTDASGAGLSFSAALGFYTKIGRIVHCTCKVTYPATGNGSNASIGGLPFTPANSEGNRGPGTVLSSIGTSLSFLINGGATSGLLYDNSLSPKTNTNMSGASVWISFFYHI